VSARGRQILTPEQVEILLEPAGPGRRFGALVIDLLLVLSLTAAVSRLALLALPAGLGPLVRGIVVVLLSWGYHVFFEVRHHGQSPGKRIVGIRVVDGRGLPLSLEQSLVRNVVRALDALPAGYALGCLASLLDGERRRLGDRVADTLVVRERPPLETDRRSGGARAFNSLQTPRMVRLARQAVSLEEREFLAELCRRADALEDRARFELMEDVGRHYREKLGVDDTRLSGENLVRGLTAALFAGRLSGAARTRAPRGGRE
jgi:uncharacterized RDD family membrane protein YckC